MTTQTIEQYYQFTNRISEIINTLSAAYCLMLWTGPFLKERRKAWRVGAAYALVMLFFDFLPVPVNAMFAYGSSVCAAFLMMLWLDREFRAQKLFLAITFFCLRWQSWRVIACVSNELFWLSSRLFGGRDGMFWFRLNAVQLTADAVFIFLLMYGAVRCLLWAYGSRREHMSGKEFLLLVTPSVFGAFAYGLFRYNNYIYERDSGKSPFELYGSYDWLILLYSLLSFAMILVITYVYRQWKTEQEEERRREVFSRQIQDLESHIAEVEGLYREMRKLRHDMGNHLMTLKRLYDREAYAEAESYAEALQREVGDISLSEASGNPVTDVILSGKRKLMEEKGMIFECDFHYPQRGKVNAFDISVILQNALSNAMEAVERERMKSREGETPEKERCLRRNARKPWISLVSYVKKNIYMIEVANSYTGMLTVDEKSGLPVTSKEGEGHGFGLENIRQAARRYLGDMEFGKEIYRGEACCVLRVMLQIEEE